MKKLYLLALMLLICSGVFAQNEKEKQEIRAEIWSDKNTNFSVSKVPAEWKAEDIVVLAKQIDYEINKRSFVLVLDENFTVHVRLKVMNNDGVKEYSELQFDVPRSDYDGLTTLGVNTEAKFFFGVRIIKENGKTTELKESDLIKLELKSKSDRYAKYKIAIPTLEAGDIIDYYYKMKIPRMVQHYFESSAFDYLLAGRYPILHQEYNILLNRKCTINAGSYNGAPEFKLISQDKNDSHYQLVDKNRAKYKAERWTYDYLNMPFFKFQTYFVGKQKGVPATAFPNNTEKLSQGISKKDFTNLSQSLVGTKSLSVVRDLSATKGYMNKYYKKEKDPLKIAQAAYYYLRHQNMANSYEYGLIKNRSMWTRLNEQYFISVFSDYLKSKKINHEIVFTTNRSSGFEVKNILFREDIRMLIAVTDKNNQRTYFNNFGFYTNPNELDPELEGMPAYAANMLESVKKRTTKEITLPVSTSTDNKEKEVAIISIEMGAEPALNIARTTEVWGQRKAFTQGQLVTGYTYLDASVRDNMEIDIPAFCKANGYTLTGDDRKNIPAKRALLKEELEAALNKDYEASLQGEFSSKNVVLNEVKVLETGIWQDAPVTKYQDAFTLKDLIQRAGPNYLLEVGKLIGSQVAIEEKEKVRVSNMQQDYAREYENRIELTVPAGYVVEGVERLNMNLQNSAGIFTSQAVQENGKIIITTKKAYLKANDTKENWKNMVAFLDAAYQFSQQKLLLKKSTQARKN